MYFVSSPYLPFVALKNSLLQGIATLLESACINALSGEASVIVRLYLSFATAPRVFIFALPLLIATAFFIAEIEGNRGAPVAGRTAL